MRILLTNDDGIHARGLQALRRIAETLSDEVWIVAPETDQSGQARSLTLSQPLRVREVDVRTFACERHADGLRHHGSAQHRRRPG